MNIWSVLGITETYDEDELKKAYRTRLATVNPEDDPQGFMELRKAYEEAVRFAKQQDSLKFAPVKEDNLQTRLDNLYKNFKKRIKVFTWEQLLQEDYFVSLETEEESFNILMRFLMEKFHLPKQVWSFLVSTFEIKERKRELCEHFPEEFIDYILNNAQYDDLIDYTLFEGDEGQFDIFIDNYFKLNNALRNRNYEEQKRLIRYLEELDVYHPFLQVSKIRSTIQHMGDEARQYLADNHLNEEIAPIKRLFSTELEEFMVEAKKLREKYPFVIEIIDLCGDIAMIQEDYETAGKYFEEALENKPDSYISHGKHAEYLYSVKRFEEARNEYMDLLKINHFDNAARNGMIRANYGFIEQLKEKISENPEDKKAKMEMVWCFYQSYQFKEAIATLDTFEPDENQIFEYANVKGRTYLCLMNYDEAREWFLIWKKEIESIPKEDNSEEAKKHRKRYEYVNFLIADCYLKQKQYDVAREYLNRALMKEHEEMELAMEAKCELEYESGDLEACIKACEVLLDRDNRSYIGFNYRSKAFYQLGYYKDAVASAENAICIYPYMSEPYCLIIDIMLDTNNIEYANNMVDRYKQYQIDSDKIDYHYAKILVRQEKIKEAIELLSAITARNEAHNQKEEHGEDDENIIEINSDLENMADVYYLLGKCYLLWNDNNRALEQFEKVISVAEDHETVYRKIGLTYRRTGKYVEAIRAFDKQIERNATGYDYVNRATLHNMLSNYKSAVEDYTMALTLDESDGFCHFRIAIIYEMHKEFDKALYHYDKALHYTDSESEDGKKRIQEIMSMKARTLQCMNRFSESEACYLEYFEQYEKIPDIVYDYSELLIRCNRLTEAIKFLSECIEDKKYQTEEYKADISMCIRQMCKLYGQEGYLDKASECFALAIEKNPEDYRAYATMASVLREHQVFDHARKLYEKAIELDTQNKENYYSSLVETIVEKKGLFKPDVKGLAAKAVVPQKTLKNPLNFIRMARLYRVMKKQKEAVKMIDDGIRQRRCNGCFYSSCHEAWYERGLIFEAKKDYETARKCYRTAIEICGHNTLYEERLKRIEDK